MSAGWQNFQLHLAKEFYTRGPAKKINNPGHHPICEYVQNTPTSHEKFCSPNVGLEPTTLRLRVSCSTDWASRAVYLLKEDSASTDTCYAPFCDDLYLGITYVGLKKLKLMLTLVSSPCCWPSWMVALAVCPTCIDWLCEHFFQPRGGGGRNENEPKI